MRRLCVALLLVSFSLAGFSQQVYFVDGYHGGIYGHYPVKWKTRFLEEQLRDHPEWKISLEIEPETWDTVQRKTPEDYLRLKERMTAERVEFTNPAYSQPYCYNISGESIIRQFQYGIKKINRHFPEVKFTAYSVEEPCFTSCLPQILKSFGFKYAVLKCPNTCWGGYMRAYGGELVNWIGPEGSSLLTVPRYACEKLENNSTWQTIAWANSDSYLKACFDSGIAHPVGMCFQDAGWRNGPWLGHGDSIKNHSVYVTWTDYIENISSGQTDDDYYLSQEDVLVNLMWGSQVLQKIGQEVREAENTIVIAEKLGTMACLENGYRYPQESMDEAWRTLMLAQHHDSWIVPYNRLNKQRTWAEEISLWTSNTNDISGNIIRESIGSFDKQQTTAGDQGFIRIYNTLGVNRKEVANVLLPEEYTETDVAVYDVDDNTIPFFTETEGRRIRLFFKADVPSFGYATYRIKRGAKGETAVPDAAVFNRDNCVLESDMYRIEFDASKGGTIKSLIAKKEKNKEYVLQNGAYSFGELRGYFYEEGRFRSSKESPARVTLLSENPLQSSIKIEGEIASHPFCQIVTITRGGKRIDFDLRIDWKHNVGIGEYKQGANWRDNRRAFCDDRFKLNVLFPTDLQSPKLYKNAPFDVCESRLENTHFNTWDSIKHNVIFHWVDLSEPEGGESGLALFSDHTSSYSYGEAFPLGLTAQYSGVGLWGWNYEITRPLTMKYAVLPHRGRWDEASVSTENSRWNEPLVCAYSPSLKMIDTSWIAMPGTGYELSSVQVSDDHILLRLYNAEGDGSLQKVLLGFPVLAADEVDLNGNVLESVAVRKTAAGSEISVAMPRFGLKTFLVRKEPKF